MSDPNPPMRILLWSGGYPPVLGGVEVVVQGLAQALTGRGHGVQVVTQSLDDSSTIEELPEGVVHRLPFHQVLSSRDPARVFELTERVAGIKRDFAPDLVHVHAIHPGEFFFLRTDHVAPCPLIFSVHGWTPLAAGYDTLRDRMLRRADWVTGVSRHVVDCVIEEIPELVDRSLTIYNGVREPAGSIAPLPFDPPRLLCVGRLVETKGFDRVLRAMPAVLARHPTTRLTIVGDGPERQKLQRQSVRLGIASRAEFVGRVSQDEVYAHMNAATLLAVPSRSAEGLPLVALQAAMLQRPVVATSRGGLPEAVVDGQTGFLVESGDREALEHALLRVLADPEEAARLGRAGRRHALEKFCWETQMSHYADLYARAAGRSG